MLLEVPAGCVTTYGDLARAAGIPNGQRFVGNVMRDNPYPGLVPCHRVVRSDGRVGRYAYGNGIKRNMLEREGINITDGRISEFDAVRFRF